MQTDSIEKAVGIGAIGLWAALPMDGLAGLLFSMPSA